MKSKRALDCNADGLLRGNSACDAVQIERNPEGGLEAYEVECRHARVVEGHLLPEFERNHEVVHESAANVSSPASRPVVPSSLLVVRALALELV